MPRFIVMQAAAKMPSKVKARYMRVAVVETDLPDGQTPKMISERAKGVLRIVETWERCHAGNAVNSAFARALTEAQAVADKLNSSNS
jgi:Ni2+-binding GTPase involved in maturation of urease and hydrogenase